MNRHQNINLRQLCICYFLYSTSIKFFTLPSTLAAGSGNFAWLSALFGVIFELITVAIACLILKFTSPGKPFFRVMCWLLLPLIVAEIWLSGQQIYHMAYTDLFTDLSLVVFIITLLILGGFMLTQKPRAVFRASEVLWLFFALGLVIAIAPTLYNLAVNWQQLGQGTFSTVFPTMGSNLLFFEAATFVLAFGSETQKTNQQLRRINLTALLCGVGYVLFMILFIVLFGPLGQFKTMGLVSLTSAAQCLTNSGGLDWLIAMAMLCALVLRFGVQLVALVTLLKRGLGRHA